MSKLVSLLKATMSEGVRLFNYRAKTERSRRLMPILLGALIGVMMFFSINSMMTDLKVEGVEVAVLALYALLTSIIIVTEGIYKSGDLLFKPRDNDMLLAMPIKKSTIVTVRLFKFYLFELIYCLIFFLPAVVAYAINVPVGFEYYLVALTMLVMLPIIPIAVSCIVGLVITAVSSRFRHKTFLQVVLSFVALFGFVALIAVANTSSGFDGNTVIAISDKVSGFYYPVDAFAKLVASFDIWQYLLFIIVNLAVGAVVVLIISRFYYKIVTRLSVVKVSKDVVVKYGFKRHGQTFAMVKKELTRYFSTPVLLMNTAIGLVLFVVAVGALCFNFDGLASTLVSSMENFPLTLEQMQSFMPGVTFALVAFASLMTFITATMISLEGKAFDLLKSMPISGKKVIMSKVLAAMLLIVPVTLVGSMVMGVRFQFEFLDMVLVLIGVIALPLVTELVGILVDLKYARFDAETDAVTVKQSASVMISTFLGLGMVLLTISLTFATVFLAGQTAGLAMMDALFVIVALYLYFAVATRGEEKYKKLSV